MVRFIFAIDQTTTKGEVYKVRGHFCYLNKYGSIGDHYWQWDQFITIKNDFGYTIKVNLNGYSKYVRPEMTLEQRVEFLENKLKQKGVIII